MDETKKTEAFELSDEAMKEVSGGSDAQYMKIICPHCGKMITINVLADTYKCDFCKSTNTLYG